MNHVYRVIFDRRQSRYRVVSELAKSTSGSGGTAVRERRGAARGSAAPVLGALAALAALALHGGEAFAACTPAAPADNDVVSCTGVPILLPPNPNSFLSNANGLSVTVQSGAIVSTLPGGTAMTLGGDGITLNNLGAIDANAAGSLVLSRALTIGNLVTPGSGNVTVNNQGTIEGTFDGTFGLLGAAAVIATTGTTTFNNSGTIGMSALGLFDPINSIAVAVYGGGNVNFTNTGTITGRVAFQSPVSGGNTFVNAGTINGSVSLGTTLSNDTFVAVTGSSINGGLVPLPGVTIPTPAIPVSFVTFAAGGTVDAGIGGNDTLVLQNTVAGPGSGSGGSGTASSLQYLNFENLVVNSGTWTLQGAVASGASTLNGGTSIFDNALSFGTGTLTANGGAIQPSVTGLTLSQNVNLTGGLIVQGANSLTLGGTLTGAGGLIKNGSGTLTLSGNNNFSGGLSLNGGGLTLDNAGSLGTGLFLVGGPAALNTAFTGTLTNQVQLNGALTLNGAGTLTLNGNINGAGSLALASGNLVLNGANNYGGGTVLQAGSIDLGSATALGTGALTVTGAATLTGKNGLAVSNDIVLNNTLNLAGGGSGGALTLNGKISGTGGMSLAGAPGLTLNGANDFSGGFNLGGGTLTVGNNLALGAGSVAVSGASSLAANAPVGLANNFNLNASLNIASSSDLALNGTIGGLGGLTQSGPAKLALGGANGFSGGVNLLGGGLGVGTNTSLGLGALTVNGAATLDASAGVNLGNAVVLNAGLAVGGGNDIALGGLVSGAGALSFNGTGKLSLNGANAALSGGVTLSSGTLGVGNNLALGTGGLGVTGNASLTANAPGIGLGNGVTLGSGTTLSLTGANALALGGTITGAGSLAVNGPGSVTLGGASDFSGGVSLAGGTLSLGTSTSLGSGTLGVAGNAGLQSAAGALTLANAVSLGTGVALSVGGTDDLTLNGPIGGGGSLIKTGTGTLVLGGANDFGGGVTLQAGTLGVGTGTSLGMGALTVSGAATLTSSADVALANDVTLNGALNVAGAKNIALGGLVGGGFGLTYSGTGTLSLGGANTYAGTTTVASGTLLATNTSGSATGTGTVAVLTGATLGGIGRIGGDVTLNTGAKLAPGAGTAGSFGVLSVGGNLSLAAGSTLDFDFGAPGSDFSTPGASDSVSVGGNLSLGGPVTLNVANAGSFGPGVYRLVDYGGSLTGAGSLSLGGLPGGSTVLLQNLSADKRFNLVNTTGLTLNFWNADGLASPVQSGGGTGTWSTTSPVWTDAAGTVTVPMQPQPGFAIFGGAPGTVTIDKTGGPVQALGMQFTSGGYTLAGDALTLLGIGGAKAEIRVGDGSAASSGFVATVNSAIAGSAGITKTGAGTLVLGGTNTYTGGTAVQGGVLSVSADANLGAAGGGLALDGGRLQVTGTGFAGTTRDIDIGAAGGGIEVVDAAHDFTASGTLGGGGTFVKSGQGTLTLAGTNSHKGATVVDAGTLRLGAADLLNPTATIALADKAGATLDLNGFNQTIGSLSGGGSAGGELKLGSATLTTGDDNTSTTFGGRLSGNGSLVKQGTGTFTLAGSNSYGGATQVNAGTLQAGAPNAFSATSAHSVAAGATLDLAGFNQTVASLNNSGTVSLPGAAAGTSLTVTGPYVGNNGVLRLGAVLNASGPSDRLVLDGASATASGRTTVQVVNLGGLGALTTGNGIEVISALNGATTTAQTTRDAFTLAGGHVDAGAYEYRLYPADANGAGENWYLRSTTGAGGPGVPGVPGGPGLPTYRAEVPLYAAVPQQLRQANVAMLGNLHLRGGDDMRLANDAGDTTVEAGRRAWGRVLSTDIDVRQRGTVSPESKGRLTGFQAGTDLWADANWRVGVYVGQLEGDVDVRGFASGIQGLRVGRSDLRSRYLGVYASWHNDAGWYTDIVLQGGQHRYTARPLASMGSSGKGDSFLASVEVGKAFDIGGGWRVEPQLQLIHQRLSMDGTSISGAWITQDTHDGLIARAGVRIKGSIATGAGLLQPYARINVNRASSGTDVARLTGPAGSTGIASETGGTSTELAGGFTLALGERTSVYGELGKLWATGGDTRMKSSLNASVGVRVRW
ncbi:outer membrane autotransporter protein [Variovorax paradoxus]|uniref:autotransporter outer membrane beta-barrel domain-containing protein n=1 Tax=Variovorax atrisoli TaxID=3394203 RepID=UPI00119A8C83|nr:autotransporter outer membrane beta-barrel domain-containing protein [Variovorax paradoxus]MDR6522549.1 outer membrane autotransporter protein [Variovorax paradoxus]